MKTQAPDTTTIDTGLHSMEALIRAVLSEKLEQFQRPQKMYFSTQEAADHIDMSTQWLEVARHKGEGPPFIKLARSVRYSREDLDAWMAARRVAPEGDGN